MDSTIGNRDKVDLISQMNVLIWLGSVDEFNGMRKAIEFMGYKLAVNGDGRVYDIEPDDEQEAPEFAVITTFNDNETSVRYVKGSVADAMRDATSDMAGITCVTIARCCGFVGIDLNGKPMTEEF